MMSEDIEHDSVMSLKDKAFVDTVERVARTIFEVWAKETGATGTWAEAVAGHAAPEEFPAMHATVELARKEARAAIEAMRDPRIASSATTNFAFPRPLLEPKA